MLRYDEERSRTRRVAKHLNAQFTRSIIMLMQHIILIIEIYGTPFYKIKFLEFYYITQLIL